MTLKYVFLIPPISLCTGLICNPPPRDILDYVIQTNEFIQEVYPLEDNSTQNDHDLLPKTAATPESTKEWKLADTCKIKLSVDRAMLDDLYLVRDKFKSKNPHKAIGIVPKGYFGARGFPITKDTKEDKIRGVFLKNIPNTFLVHINETPAFAHELGHSFGLPVPSLTKTDPQQYPESYRNEPDPNDPNNCIPVAGGDVPGRIEGYNVYTEEKIIPDDQAFDFMGRVSKDKYWVHKEHWEELTEKLSTISKVDPELISIGVIISKDGTAELLDWSVGHGFYKPREPGKYRVILKDDSGSVISEIPFDLSFTLVTEPLGGMESNLDLVAFSLPYPLATSSLSIIGPDDLVYLEVDPLIKVLNDTIFYLDDGCFINNPIETRQALLDITSEMKFYLESGDYPSSIELMGSISSIVNNEMIENCSAPSLRYYSTQELINTLDSSLLHLDGRLLFADSDGDGVSNKNDVCPASNLSRTVLIDNCDSYVDNYVLYNGCSINDQINTCSETAVNHGHFVSCISEVTNYLVGEEILIGKEKGAIQSCIAKSKNE